MRLTPLCGADRTTLKPRAASVRFPALDGSPTASGAAKTARIVAARMKSVVTSLGLFGARIAAGAASAQKISVYIGRWSLGGHL